MESWWAADEDELVTMMVEAHAAGDARELERLGEVLGFKLESLVRRTVRATLWDDEYRVFLQDGVDFARERVARAIGSTVRRGEPIESVRAFAADVARKRTIDWVRNKGVQDRVRESRRLDAPRGGGDGDDDRPALVPEVEDYGFERVEDRDEVQAHVVIARRLLGELRDRDPVKADAVEAYFLDEEPVAHIAARLDVRENTVDAWCSRFRRAVRDAIAEAQEDDDVVA